MTVLFSKIILSLSVTLLQNIRHIKYKKYNQLKLHVTSHGSRCNFDALYLSVCLIKEKKCVKYFMTNFLTVLFIFVIEGGAGRFPLEG